MEVHVTAEQEAKLVNLAAQEGREPDELLRDFLDHYLNDETRFIAGVDRGIRAAERGEFIEEEEMDARVERMFRS